MTPLFGMALFAVVRCERIRSNELVRACACFYFAIGAALGLTIAFPSLVAFLPSMVLGR